METRANYILIGVFTVLLTLGVVGFVVWLAKIELDREFNYYEIHFAGSVSGLSKAGDVRYNGLKVGQIVNMTLHPKDPGKVVVLIEVESDFPVHENAIASMEYQGITGISYVEISGALGGGKLLAAKPGEEYPVIPSQPSNFQELFSGAPDLIKSGIELLNKLNKLVNEENRESIANILNNAETITGAVAAKSSELQGFIANLESATLQVRETAASIDALAQTLDKSASANLDPLLADARETAQSANRLVSNLDDMVARNQEAVDVFASDGLTQFTRLMVEARQFIANLSRLVSRIESDPARFLFGTQDAEFEVKEGATK